MVKLTFRKRKKIRISFQLENTQNSNDISLIAVLTHIRTQRQGLIQTAEQLRYSSFYKKI
jgi:hypothetical protein